MKSFKETAIIARLNQCFINYSCQSNKQKLKKGVGIIVKVRKQVASPPAKKLRATYSPHVVYFSI